MCYNISYETICSEADVMAESNEMYKKKPQIRIIVLSSPKSSYNRRYALRKQDPPLRSCGRSVRFADVYARFLRDRIGKENVIFVSGTDCYGSPIAEGYRKACAEQGFTGTIRDYVQRNHDAQKKTLDDYDISLDLFGASALGDTAEWHNKVSDAFIRKLYEMGHLKRYPPLSSMTKRLECSSTAGRSSASAPFRDASPKRAMQMSAIWVISTILSTLSTPRAH